MADALTNDLYKYSVTSDDMPKYQGNGVVNFIIPWFMLSASNLPLPSELPPYWSLRFGVAAYWSRDLILRTTILHEAFWAGAVSKTATKAAAKSFDLTGNRINRFQDMLLDWGGDGYVPSQQRGLLDYLTTNNGEFWEIVRVSNAAGSRIIGLVHLDSLRIIRTGDIETPFLFLDLRGRYHELKDYQVISLVDMPDTATASLGIGHCAAERAYGKIYTVAVMEQYFKEKITGTGANTLDIISGVNDAQLQGVVQDGKAEATRRGQVYYQGHIIMGLLSQVDLKNVSIPLRELPDGYDHEKELQIAQLAYANAIGIDPQEINPALLAKGALGVGAQSVVLAEKSAGYGPAAREKHLTHLLNRDILPESVTFAFRERDLRDEQQQAAIGLARAQMRTAMITDGTITAQEARQLAADSKDIPQEFLTIDQTQNTAVTDEEKPAEQSDLQPGVTMPQATTPAPAPAQPAKPGQPGAPNQPQAQPAQAQPAPMSNEAVDKIEEASGKPLNLNGAQVQAVMGIVQSVGEGKITRPAAINMLKTMFGMTTQQASSMFAAADEVMPEEKEFSALIALKESIDAARNAMGDTSQAQPSWFNRLLHRDNGDQVVRLPEIRIPAPVVNPPAVTVQAPEVIVNPAPIVMPEYKETPQPDWIAIFDRLADALKQPAPVVNVAAPEVTVQPEIKVEMKAPEKKPVKFVYDEMGRIVGTE